MMQITLIILGYGGIGSNISLLKEHNIYSNTNDLSYTNLVCIDDDKIEFSNLNRSNFKFREIGSNKTNIVTKVTTFEDLMKVLFDIAKQDNSYGYFRNYQIEKMFEGIERPEDMTPDIFRSRKTEYHAYVIDCRDTFAPEAIFDGIDFKLTYNGAFIIRIEYNPYLFGDAIFNYNPELRYQTMPSFVTPPLYIVERLYQLLWYIESIYKRQSKGDYLAFRMDKDKHFQEHINLRLRLEKMTELVSNEHEVVKPTETVVEDSKEAPDTEPQG